MSLLMILLTIFLPPVAVLIKEGLGLQFLLNVLLTLIGWLPGVIHAFWVNTRGSALA
ncbi:YqaE/Pmp3 family membrane protein [Hyphomonas sp. WL0036]|uniref:YqaE/Pmp3 family membrane protein n=1 Tax=Hyphomonas sediminis TaxID=2866160 RepID=UPI001C81EA60|nr:YqaE/Pmp3 family membrane protein [Hyphomonas sediminis]MBY9066005.1 YqaE/Pmp3 family membrane protein [Hyphomonas sediminis]